MLFDRVRTVEIVSVGTELLMGQIINTNAAFFAKELRDLGCNSYYQTVVGDNPKRLRECLETALSRSDAVLVSGGLGPTSDDISMAAAAEVCGLKLELRSEALRDIEQYFKDRGRNMAASNRKQAMMPKEALMLPNHNGTAPGAILPAVKGGRTSYIILLPGPPDENQKMFKESLRPWFRRGNSEVLDNIFVRVIGIGESDAAELLGDLLDDEHANPSLAPYCSVGEISFRLSYKHEQGTSRAPLDSLLLSVKEKLGDYIYEIGERTLFETAADLLFEQNKSVAFAESLTAGMASSELASVPGISRVLKGGITAYQNEIKEKLLGVRPETLSREGAVSADCVREMARSVRQMFDADFGVALSGNAGPEPSEGKAVGRVYIAVADADEVLVKAFNFKGDRAKIRTLAVKQSINMLRLRLLGKL